MSVCWVTCHYTTYKEYNKGRAGLLYSYTSRN